ncbi:hypothetical protein CRV06_01220 [Halarcobacter anaerophilus]|uniref:UPF0056 membrane protein n=1 Tax=Halarcobacter anaerophilus TaxID=877500 RepID=A0A4Q0Y3A8_9BACT|nr:hypothetical protein CRV06_01220 [Halarcobacter anaerophilus]
MNDRFYNWNNHNFFWVFLPLTFLCFIFGSKILGILGKNGLNIVTRLMGLILRVIGVQRLIEGASDIYTMLIK